MFKFQWCSESVAFTLHNIKLKIYRNLGLLTIYIASQQLCHGHVLCVRMIFNKDKVLTAC